MIIERHLLTRSSIDDFADEHGLTMEVHERSAKPSPTRFYAHFSHCDVVDGMMLVGEFGNGASEQDAVRAYAAAISDKTLVVNAHTQERREIHVPILVEVT